MNVNLGKQFSKDLASLAKTLEGWSKDAEKRLKKAHEEIGEEHRQGAVRRVPVDEGNLANRILTNTYRDPTTGDLITETGTNVKDYPVYVEFGTKRIAGGRVLALGDDAGITDAQAVKSWPAKEADQVATGPRAVQTEARVEQAAKARSQRGGPNEQMPWLRPAFNAIRDWAVEQINNAFKPPKKR